MIHRTLASEHIHTSYTILLDPEHKGVAVIISQIVGLQSEIQVFPVSRPPFLFGVEHCTMSPSAIVTLGVLKTNYAAVGDVRHLIQW